MNEKLLAPVDGGATRQDSVRLGLESLAQDAPGAVLIHDGARPLIDGAIIGRTLDALEENIGAIAALPLSDEGQAGWHRRVLGNRLHQVRPGLGPGIGIVGVMGDQHLGDQGGVLKGARKYPYLIQKTGLKEYAVPGN